MSWKTTVVGALVLIGAAAGLPAALDRPQPAQGGPFPSFTFTPVGALLVVDTVTYPGVNGDGFCSLDEAINATNTNSNADPSSATCDANASSPGATDGISFALGSGVPTINITSGTHVIVDKLSIDGATGGATRVRLLGSGAQDGGDGLRVLGDDSSGTTISSLVFEGFGRAYHNNGTTSTLNNSIVTGNNVGVSNEFGTFTLTDSTVTGNVATGPYAPVYNNGAPGSPSPITIMDSMITGNTGPLAGGIFIDEDGILTMSGTSVIDNSTVSTASGGGIGGDGTVNINDSIVSGNTTPGGGGGGISSAAATIVNSTISDNQALGSGAGGGGIQTTDLTLINSVVSGNYATGRGGGIAFSNAVIINSTISGNTADRDGGGIYANGTTDLYNVTVTENLADADTAGGGSGGEVFNAGTFNFTNTIIAGNFDTQPGPLLIPNDCSGTLTS